MTRLCPRALPGAEHEMRLDRDGHWYCPIERDAERGRAYAERLAEIEALELAFAGPVRSDAQP